MSAAADTARILAMTAWIRAARTTSVRELSRIFGHPGTQDGAQPDELIEDLRIAREWLDAVVARHGGPTLHFNDPDVADDEEEEEDEEGKEEAQDEEAGDEEDQDDAVHLVWRASDVRRKLSDRDLAPAGRPSAKELWRVYAAGFALAHLLPTNAADQLRAAMGEVRRAATDVLLPDLDEQPPNLAEEEPLAPEGAQPAAADDEPSERDKPLTMLELARHGVERQLRMRLHYQGRADPGPRWRTVDPLCLARGGPYTYLWAYDLEADQQHPFRLDRLHDASLTAETVEHQVDEPLLAPEFTPGEGDPTVRLRLDPGAWWILDRIGAESIDETEQGGPIEVAFRTDALDWVAGLVESAGGAAVVLHPPELAEAVREAAEAGVERYR